MKKKGMMNFIMAKRILVPAIFSQGALAIEAAVKMAVHTGGVSAESKAQ